MTPTDSATIHYRDEVVRKLIHLCSLSIPIVYYFIPRNEALIILGAVTAFALVIELLRHYSKGFGRIFLSMFGFLLRKHELDEKKKNLNGATYVLISALICVFVFPKVLVITAFSILIISDTMAALIGRKFGKHKFLSKSLEGTLAFFISAIIVVLIAPKIEGLFLEYLIGILAAAIAAIVENISYGWIDDNLSIPVSIGLAMWGLYLWWLPHLDLILRNVPR
jgi:dolichol kinase